MGLYKQQDYSAEVKEMAVAAARKRRNPVNPIYLKKFALFVDVPSRGERSGRGVGMR